MRTALALFIGLTMATTALAGENEIPPTEHIRIQVEQSLRDVCPGLGKERECKIEFLRLNVMLAEYDKDVAVCRLYAAMYASYECPKSGGLQADRVDILQQIERIRRTYGFN